MKGRATSGIGQYLFPSFSIPSLRGVMWSSLRCARPKDTSECQSGPEILRWRVWEVHKPTLAFFASFLQTRAKTLDKCLVSMIYFLLRWHGGCSISRPTRRGDVRGGKEDEELPRAGVPKHLSKTRAKTLDKFPKVCDNNRAPFRRTLRLRSTRVRARSESQPSLGTRTRRLARSWGSRAGKYLNNCIRNCDARVIAS
jgi:hypothetical protein